MKHDSKAAFIAQVDVENVRYSKGKELGIDYSNEIDVWTKMEFRSRQQIKELSQTGKITRHEVLKNLTTLFYTVREKIE